MSAVRRATEADVPAMARIVSDWIAATPWNSGGPGSDALEGLFRRGLAIREIWVAGEPAEGYLSLEPERSWIHGFYVARPGHGLGKRLLDRAKEGRDMLGLRSHTPNHAAHRFYAREGFAVVERDLPGEDGVTELRMEWRR